MVKQDRFWFADGSSCDYLFKTSGTSAASEHGIVLLHGYGANMHDIMSFTYVINALDSYDIYSLDAPYSMGTVAGSAIRMWFQLESWMIELISSKLPSAQSQHYEHDVTPDYQHSYQLVYQVISQLLLKYQHLVILGFSQGGMLAADVAVSLIKQARSQAKASSLKGMALLSTACFQHRLYANLRHLTENTFKLQPLAAPLKVFQSHGTLDEVVLEAHGRYLHEKLHQAFPSALYHSAKDGHTITSSQLSQLNNWLQHFLPPKQ